MNVGRTGAVTAGRRVRGSGPVRAALVLWAAATLSACTQSDAFRPLEVGDPAPQFAARRLDGSDVSFEIEETQLKLEREGTTLYFSADE